MPAESTAKREQEFKKLERQFKKDRRYPGREKEVAARVVNKQRSQYGETKGQKLKDKQGKAPDRNLPIADYQQMTIPEVLTHLNGLSNAEVRKIRTYESHHKNRKGLMEKLERRLAH